jgi:hypothetical protein
MVGMLFAQWENKAAEAVLACDGFVGIAPSRSEV